MDIPIRKIIYSVVIIHLIFLSVFIHKKKLAPNLHREIYVKTYIQKEKKIGPVKQQIAAQSKAKKQPTVEQTKKKTTTTKTQSNAEKAKTKISSSLLKELKEGMDSISSGDIKFEKKEIIVPKKILDLKIDQPPDTEGIADEVPFETLLSDILQQGLTLPDYGEVKARITCLPNGSLMLLEILESKSRANESYLKNRLPEIAFPCFNSAIVEKKVVVTFKNQ